MKRLARNLIAVFGALSIMALGPAGTLPCPNPIIVSVTRGGTTSTTPDSVDFPNDNLTSTTYNGTHINQNFGDTFHFFKPQKKQCCQWYPGTLTVTYRALQGGCNIPIPSSTSANDFGGLVYHGASVPGSSAKIPWIWHVAPPGVPPCTQYVSTGDTVTVSYAVPANIVASGRVSFAVEDDSAVISATLRVRGCCLTPTPIRP